MTQHCASRALPVPQSANALLHPSAQYAALYTRHRTMQYKIQTAAKEARGCRRKTQVCPAGSARVPAGHTRGGSVQSLAWVSSHSSCQRRGTAWQACVKEKPPGDRVPTLRAVGEGLQTSLWELGATMVHHRREECPERRGQAASCPPQDHRGRHRARDKARCNGRHGALLRGRLSRHSRHRLTLGATPE
ncbi:hypothetical protein NDU88_007438 [Pleurodeles waltl]|uniref:Uncharacterized protein n=1 Tax=Pleurodeles waltl TaxID=8319 RepID=A0AAV7SSH8_PLEWA|nr:hypothetical protein NDU88_007438 [Pleurodeles waltl]